MGIRWRPPRTVRELLENASLVEHHYSMQARLIGKVGGELRYALRPDGLELSLRADGRSGEMRVELDGVIALRFDLGDGLCMETARAGDEFELHRCFAQFRRAVLGGVVPPLAGE